MRQWVLAQIGQLMREHEFAMNEFVKAHEGFKATVILMAYGLIVGVIRAFRQAKAGPA